MRVKGVVGLLLALSLLAGQAHGFFPKKWMASFTSIFAKERTISHVQMTATAIEVVVEEMAKAKESTTGYKVNYKSTPSYNHAKDEILTANANTDSEKSTKDDPRYHFDAEMFVAAQQELVSQRNGLIRLLHKDEVTSSDYSMARKRTGKILHTLQDFYSHSNWIEMGNTEPKNDIFDLSAEEVAGPDVPTCTNCGSTCSDNIRTEINANRLLTSGYYSSQYIESELIKKPEGKWKCSHGGLLDFTRFKNAQGGINKDSSRETFSPHYKLHGKAVDVAIKATINFFRDLRREVDNDLVFGRYMGFEQTTSIGFVIDTTGSMEPYIDDVRMEIARIIDERAINGELPTLFMLVPFNDPGEYEISSFDNVNLSNILKKCVEVEHICNALALCFIKLCLSAIEPQSEIFIFTDASAKDKDLQLQAAAIAEKKKCKVNVVVVRTPSSRRFFDNQGNFKRKRRSINALSYYDEIAFSSGGLAFHPTSSEFQSLMVVIGDLSKAQQVNILNVRDVDTTKSTVLRFPVDSSTSNIVIFYTGALYTLTNITISDPSGTRDDAVAGNTTLLSTQIYGNYFIMQLREPKLTGIWQIQITSEGLSSLRIIGQSSLNFIYKFGVEDDVGPHPGIRVITNRPSAGVPLLVEVTITDEDTSSAIAETLTLLSPDGRPLQIIPLYDTSPGGYIGKIDSLPEEQFCVYVSGKDSKNNTFGRVFPTVSHVTTITLQIVSQELYPKLINGTPAYLNISVTNSGDADTFEATASADAGFIVTIFPSNRFNISRNSSVILTLKLEANSAMGIGIFGTISLVVQGANSTSNFIVTQAEILKYDDEYLPTCETLTETKCPNKLESAKCKFSTWNATIRFNDTGSGIKMIDPPGDMSNNGGEKTLTKSFSGDCCNTSLNISITDIAGNTRVCSYDMKYDDASLPTCEMLTETKCPNKLEGAKCKSSTWNANIRFNDTGSGIKMIDPPSDMSTNVGEKTLTKSFSGDCCNTSLSISITDIAGNTRVCSYDMKYDDASLPTCEMLTETKCPNKLEGAKCKSSTWTANIRFNDTGSGIKMIDPSSDMSTNVGEKTLTKSFSGDCCNTSLSISITDIAGNTRVCSYDMKYDDASLPTCETLTETKCSNKLADAKCKSSKWNVTIRFDDTGSGIKMINPPGDMSNNVGEKTLTKSYSGDCCNTVFSVDVTDMAGNLRVCSYDMKESKTSAGFTVFHIGIWEMVILAFGLALSGITIVM
ncbi:von Willebrand factor A domain-containing protein 7-like [Lethenteron reissneri]|uniref:von Willebrand factor A domain-containing protein 7-like n=1 Tax=Lethenteron reissneri TaxID=7753 RepID=UPI002AB73DBD|nr:von Willebrand factor A domain-containing protein 7-like [Lethenteron reissneri]